MISNHTAVVLQPPWFWSAVEIEYLRGAFSDSAVCQCQKYGIFNPLEQQFPFAAALIIDKTKDLCIFTLILTYGLRLRSVDV